MPPGPARSLDFLFVSNAGQLLEQIARREPVDAEAVAGLVRDWESGAASEAQMGAWCMAMHLGGLDAAGLAGVVNGLVAAGDRLELGRIGPSAVVHSLGAVGDPSALIASTIAASMDVRVPYLCARGTDHIGGDHDRLEAVAGYRSRMEVADFVRCLRDVGLAVAGEVERLAPARGKLAVLSQSVGLAASAPIATAGAMAAAIASGAQGIVMVFPVGPGGLAARSDVTDVAGFAADIAEIWGRELRVLSLPVDTPRSPVVGNGHEIRLMGEVLRGEREGLTRDFALEMAGAMAEVAGVAEPGDGRGAAEEALTQGHALASAERWIDAQGGDPALWTEPEGLIPAASLVEDIVAPRDGTVTAIDPRGLGAAARWVGAGRMHPSQAIDVSVGVRLRAVENESVRMGQVIAHVDARDDGLATTAAAMVEQAIEVDGEPIGGREDA